MRPSLTGADLPRAPAPRNRPRLGAPDRRCGWGDRPSARGRRRSYSAVVSVPYISSHSQDGHPGAWRAASDPVPDGRPGAWSRRRGGLRIIIDLIVPPRPGSAARSRVPRRASAPSPDLADSGPGPRPSESPADLGRRETGTRVGRRRLMALRWTLVALAIAVVAVGVAALTEGEPLSEVVATRGSLVLVPVLIATTSLLVIVTCRTAVDAHAEGFRPATLLWIAVVLGCLALVWPAVLLVLCWSVVLSGLDTIILLPPASEISGAIAGILHPARLLAAGGGLTVLALATSATALDVRRRSGRRAGTGASGR